MKLMGLLIIALLACTLLKAGEDSTFAIANFDDPADLNKLEFDKANVELSVGPRTPTEMNNVLKYSVLNGQYPGFSLPVPKSLPKDWSKYEALSFVVWTPSNTSLSLRIDDEKSFNYNSRYNGGTNLTKGRTLVQIPIKNIAKSIDVSRIKFLMIFTCDPPKGLTLWFDDLQLGPLQADKVEFIPYAERYDLTPSLEFVTPHLPLGRNLAGGPLPVFMLTSVKYGREVVELMQRMDLKVSQLTWDREWGANTWGFGDFYGKRGHSIDYVLMQKYLDSSMQGPEKFGTMVMFTPLGWNRFTKSAREAILRRVKENGEGLVLMMPFPGDAKQPWPDDLKEISALIDSTTDWIRDGCDVRYANEGRLEKKKWVKLTEHPITRGVPIEALPFQNMETQKYNLAPDAEALIQLESGEPVLAVKRLGKGRVVTFATRALSLTPVIHPPQDFANKIPYRFWEAWYSLENRAIAWAAGREFQREGPPVEVKPESAHADPAFTLKQWLNQKGQVTDWELVFTPPTEVRIELQAPEAVKPGELIEVSFPMPAEGNLTALLGEIVEGQWRTLETVGYAMLARPTPGTPIKMKLPTTRVRQLMAYVKIEARNKDKLLATGKAEVIITPEAKWDDYEVHTWLEGGLPFLFDHEMALMRSFGLTANTVSPWDHKTCKDLFRGGMRVHAVGLTNGLHARDIDAQEKKYKETKDKQHLIRHPSYADPEFVAKERKLVGDYASGLEKFAPLSMIMSDETALTSYTREFDFDFHPNNVDEFRAKLKARFGEITALNAAVGTDFKSFEELQPPTTEEAKAAKNFGLWNEWRAHNDDIWTGAFQMYAQAMKQKWPPARISVSGTQEQAVFNGIDWAKLSPVFEAICGYGGRFQELQRLSFHPGGLRVTPWGGYGRSGRAVDQQVWSSLVTGGSGMALFWWYSMRNADFTLCRSAKDYQRVIGEVKAGIAKQYMLSRRTFTPVAILWSGNSQRAAWSLGKFDEFKKTEHDVVSAVLAAELDPFFVSETAMAAGELERRGAKVLLMPMSLSIGLGLKKGGLPVMPALQKFVERGGIVLCTHDPAVDEFLQAVKLPEACKARLLNFADVKDKLTTTLAAAGAQPMIRLIGTDGARPKNVSATVHSIPGESEALLITVLRAPVGSKDVVGADGVIHSVPDTSAGKEVETLQVDASTLGQNLNFYDVRNKQPLKAEGGKFTIQMRAGDGYPIAALPYTVEKLNLSTELKDRDLIVAWELGSSTKKFTTHVARIECVDASGKAVPHLCANVLTGKDGKGSFTFPLATEEQQRKFGVRVRDVLTGVSEEK